MKVSRMTPEQLAAEIARGEAECDMTDCPLTATHLLIVNAHGDNTTLAFRCCEGHFKFLAAELQKSPDYLYTVHATGDGFFGGKAN